MFSVNGAALISSSARLFCSAGFQPAVSPTSSRLHAEQSQPLRIRNPRYSRLEVRATPLQPARRPARERFRSSLAEEDLGVLSAVLLLPTTIVPSSAIDLARLLNESLQRIFVTESDPVTVRERSYPNLDLISISLDGARLRPNPPRSPAISGEASPALEVNQLTLTASPLYLGPAVVNLSLSAREVRLGQGRIPTTKSFSPSTPPPKAKLKFPSRKQISKRSSPNSPGSRPGSTAS